MTHNIQSVYKLSSSFRNGKSIKTIDDLKPCYLDFIAQNYSQAPVNRSSDLIVEDQVTVKTLLEYFEISELNDLQQENMVGAFYDSSGQKSRVAQARQCFGILREL